MAGPIIRKTAAMAYAYEEPPRLQIATWGDSEETRAAVARITDAHARAWFKEQRQRQAAEDLGNLVRDAVIDGQVTAAAITSVLVNAPPPPLNLGSRLRAALRLVFFQGASDHARKN